MMAVLSVIAGIIGSLITQSWLPVVAMTAIAVIIQEVMLYDIHRHLIHLEENIHG